jgi:DNA repair exonuclease SbcCD nuclease subunit
MVRILHTSDIHIGRAFEQFGAFGRDLRSQIKETIRKVLQLAASERVEAVVMSGDVFDSDKVAPSDLKFFMDTVSSIQPVQVFFLPGTWTHDSLYQKAIYRSQQFRGHKPGNLYIFTSETVETVKLAAGRLAIHGRAVLPDSGNPLDGLAPDPRAEFNVLLLHTGIALPQIPEDKHGCLLKREHVENCGFSYLAMGDRHTFTRYFADTQTFVQYPGSPETLQFRDAEGSGFVAMVSLGENGVSVERVPTGHYEWRELTVPWNNAGSLEGLQKRVEPLADPRRILRLTLTGTVSNNESVDAEHFYNDVAPKFAYLDIDTTNLQYETTLQELEQDYREKTVEHQFVRLVQTDLKATADPEVQRQLSEVLRRGHALFQGTEGLTK